MVSSVSLIGGNVRDDKVEDGKVISTAMESGSGNTEDGKDAGDNGRMTCGAEVLIGV